jgi:hypothetical protein
MQCGLVRVLCGWVRGADIYLQTTADAFRKGARLATHARRLRYLPFVRAPYPALADGFGRFDLSGVGLQFIFFLALADTGFEGCALRAVPAAELCTSGAWLRWEGGWTPAIHHLFHTYAVFAYWRAISLTFFRRYLRRWRRFLNLLLALFFSR